MYILECVDGSYYTGSTKSLELRLQQHQNGEGANHTKKRLPVKLVYFEEYERIDTAFYREKQVQGWSRKKKEALIKGKYNTLPKLARNYKQYPPLAELVEANDSTPLPEPVEGSNTRSTVPLPEPVEGSSTQPG